jgi:hypothetical protein
MNTQQQHRYTPEEEGETMNFIYDIRLWLNSMDLDSKSGIRDSKRKKQKIVEQIKCRTDEWARRKLL